MLLSLKLKPSYRLAVALVAAHAGAATAAWMTDLPPAVRGVIIVVLAASCALAVFRSALLATRDAVVALECLEDGGVAFQTRDGAWHAARPLPTSFVTAGLTVLNLATTEKPRVRHVVMMPDSAGRDEYRRLRTRLQWDRSGYA